MKKILLILVIFNLFIQVIYSQTNSSFSFLNRILGQNQAESDKSIQRLSSASLLWTDDPATHAIFEKVKSHIDYLSVNLRSQQDLISYYNTKDGYLEQLSDSLQRIRELILKKSNGIYGPDDRDMVDSEIFYHYQGILKVISWAQFNTKPLFGSWMDDNQMVNRFKEADFYTIEGLDRILGSVLSERAKQGAIVNTINYRSNGLSNEKLNSYSFLSHGDTSFDSEISNLKRSEIMFFSNLFLLKLQVQ
jgi:flagellin-like hook-associated protein FlgL